MKNIFQNILKGKVVIVGIGNSLRRDDGFGPALIEKITPLLRVETRFVCLDTGSAPENYIGKIIKEKPDTILLVDAVHLGLSPGEYDILKPEEIIKSGFTTHDISPAMFIEHLEQGTNTDIYFLGVQPKDVSFGEEMSEPVKETLEKITEQIIKNIEK
jgi:hydrogenase 3 maturation protease